MNVDDDQCVDFFSFARAKLAPNHFCENLELRRELVAVIPHGQFIARANRFEYVLHFPGPPNLRPHESDHSKLFFYPLFTIARHVSRDSILAQRA